MTCGPRDKCDGVGSDANFRRREQVLEVGVFLVLIVPSMALSLFAVRQGQLGFTLAASAIMLRDLALVCLILFFLWRNGDHRHLPPELAFCCPYHDAGQRRER